MSFGVFTQKGPQILVKVLIEQKVCDSRPPDPVSGTLSGESWGSDGKGLKPNFAPFVTVIFYETETDKRDPEKDWTTCNPTTC